MKQDGINTTTVTDADVPASVAEFSSADLSDANLLPLPSPHRHKKLLTIILVIVLCLLLLLMGYTVAAKNFTLYARTLKQMQFDYRYGELTDEALESITQTTADIVKDQLDTSDKGLRIQAIAMLFNENGTYTPTLTLYDYYHTADKTAADTITMKTCAEYWFPTEITKLMQFDDGSCMVESDGKYVETDEMHIPDLYSYCFVTEETKGVEHYTSYYSQVDGTLYLCEIWLMEEKSGDEIVYNTIYRYYNGVKLCAVRLLPSYSTNMLVLDITDYHAE